MTNRSRKGLVAGFSIAAFALIAVLAAAPLALRAEDEEEAGSDEHSDEESAVEEPSAHEEPAAEEESTGDDESATDETTSREAFAYHGMVIEDGEVVEDPDHELLEELFASVSEGADEMGTRAPASLSSTAYSVKCKGEGVPLPPPFTSSDWKKVGRLPANRIFASKLPRADVMIYRPVDGSKKPLGLCVALPRGDESGSVELLGVICQGKSSGKACFWDNVDRTAAPRVPPARVTATSLKGMDIDLFADGSLLGENCTNCHRGENVFVIHEDTFLAKAPMDGAARDPEITPYAPIGQVGKWVNPQHANPPSNCTNCHTLPEFSKPYCTTVLLKSLGETMPPAPRPADWKKGYKAEIAQICSECGSTSGICAP